MTLADDIAALKQAVNELKTAISSLKPIQDDLEPVWAAIAEIKAQFTVTEVPPVVGSESVPVVEPAPVQPVAETSEQTAPSGN